MEPFFFELDIDGDAKQICLVDLRSYQTQEELAEFLVSEHARALERIEWLIIRPDVDMPVTDVDGLNIPNDALLRRVPRAEVRVLYSHNFQHYLTKNLVSQGSEDSSRESSNSPIQHIQELELKHYVDSTDALLSARKGFVYRAPSGHYVSRFLRVGSIQRSRQALDAVFFWLLPYLKGCGALLADTWSISSIILNTARLYERYQGEMQCRVEFLPTYFDGGPDSKFHAHSILRHTRQGAGSTLVLFSAVRSGRSLTRFRELIEEVVSTQEVKYLALFGLSAALDVERLCTYAFGFDSAPKDGTVITIDSSSFFPVGASDRELLIARAHAKLNKSFFSRYKGTEAIRIHRDIRDSNGIVLRHHAFDIDVSSLLKTKKFKKAFLEKLDGLPEPSVVIVPTHDAGVDLAECAGEFLKKKYGRRPEFIVHSDLDTSDPSLNKTFERTVPETELLILDDVSTSGQRLSRYQANLRAWRFRGHISYLVGVARPDDERAWGERVQNLRPGEEGRNNDVEYVENIVLPNWGEKNCPWCMEYEWLSHVIRSRSLNGDSLNLAIDRHALLQSAADSKGLVDDVFWIPPTQMRPKITRRSIFLSHTEVAESDVMVSVAGAIQRMRVEGEEARRLRPIFPGPTILSPNNFLGPSPRFNDAILKMAILRAAQTSEVTRWEDKDEACRSQLLVDAIVEDSGIFSLELIVGVSQRKFPFIPKFPDNCETSLLQSVSDLLSATLKQQ